MEYSVFLTEQAKSDLAEICSYILVELKSKKSAESVIDTLQRQMLLTFRQIHRLLG